MLLRSAATTLLLTASPLVHQHHPLVRRATLPRCNEPEQIPDEAMKQIPPEQLAQAWQRDEKAKELVDLLKGCPLYVVGLSARKNAVGRALARRLGTYRLLDAPALMLSTYKQLSGGDESLSMQQLMTSEPLEDVRQLSTAVMREMQQYTRSVVVTCAPRPPTLARTPICCWLREPPALTLRVCS